MGVSTVITSGKGGVGKSTAVVGIGRALAQMGRRVLLLDCDAGLRSLDRMTGIEEGLVYDSSDVVYGRCAPIDAIYPCPGQEKLYLMPAPSSGESAISPGVYQRLVPLLKRYFDHVLLDSPAGVGTGFKGAVIAADRALVVCNPDPVSVRAAATAGRLLSETGIFDRRLIINRLNVGFFRSANAFDDLDSVIDETGMRLIGVVPEDLSLAASLQKGTVPAESSRGMMAFKRISARLEGEDIPLVEF